jgi:DNA-binding response OmpR family regulator
MSILLDKRPSLLLVDDEEELLMLMKTRLQKDGFRVQLALNGDHLFEKIMDDPPDAILLDIAMDHISGNDICKQLKTDVSTRHIPIIMFSGNDDIEEITRECGADAFLSKPFNMTVVKDKIMRLLRRGGSAGRFNTAPTPGFS